MGWEAALGAGGEMKGHQDTGTLGQGMGSEQL